MNPAVTAALLALTLTACLAAPSNEVVVGNKEETEVATVAERVKGAMEKLNGIQNDAWVNVCADGACKLQQAAQAKAQVYESLQSVEQAKGDSRMAELLAAPRMTTLESMKGLENQKLLLENLNAQMQALTARFDEGSKASSNMDAMFASTVSKGINFAPPPSKGAMMAPQPPSKGAYARGASMQLEAAMCPMTMYELGKCQKLSAEIKAQLDSVSTMNAVLNNQKNNLENQLAVCEVSKAKEAEQAQFNARYAAEQKNRADSLERALALANAEKAALQRQKANLESTLASTQAALAAERQTTAMLTSALKDCNEDKAQLQAEKAALIDELSETQAVLRQTQRDLEDEQAAHAQTRRELENTQEELALSEDARRKLEEAKQELEDELAETKSQLEVMTAERDALQTNLDATSAMLEACNADKLKCQVDLSQEKAISAQLSQQLQDAMTLLEAEKKAREELTNTILMVKAASEKVQAEVQRLQLENVQLQQQLAKLRSEQEAALAVAAGCPPTYEKFGLSCYKYVREKTQWKMAQEQCMKDGANLVSIESKNEQTFLVDYLKRHGASEKDYYSLTSGYKKMENYWKWLGSSQSRIGESGPEYWFNQLTKNKPGYDCQAMYLKEPSVYGKWVGLPCYSAAPYTCEYTIAPAGMASPASAAETLAMYEMSQEAPAYLNSYSSSKGAYQYAPSSKGAYQYAPSYGLKGM